MATPRKDAAAAAVPVKAATPVDAGPAQAGAPVDTVPVAATNTADASLVDTATEQMNTPELAGVLMVRLRAIEPIRADGVDHAPGDVFSLAFVAAQALLASGAAEQDDAP